MNSARRARGLLILVFITAGLVFATGYWEFTVFERIKFSVPGDWPVVGSKSTPDKTVFAFQIPNAAEEGTSDSSNLSIVSSYLKNGQDRDAFDKKSLHKGEH